jgi:hypothetical protein
MWVSAEEQIVVQYLQHCGENGASAREICRKASTKDSWKENERWALPFISSLMDKKLIERSPAGAYRLPPKVEK